MRATVMFNGSIYTGELLRETGKRIYVRFTTPTNTTRDSWFSKTPKPEGHVISRRVAARPGDVTLPANSGFIHKDDETMSKPHVGQCAALDAGGRRCILIIAHATNHAATRDWQWSEDENPRQKGDDDGVEYGDPRDERDERRRQ